MKVKNYERKNGRIDMLKTRMYVCIGFILDKKIGVNCPKRIENANILIANTCKYGIIRGKNDNDKKN